MLEIKANQLKPGDEYTIDEGESWRTVQHFEGEATMAAGDLATLLRLDDGRRVWHYSEEMVIVR